MVIGTAERHIQIFNLSNPSTPFKVFDFNVMLDYTIAAQVADSSCFVLCKLYWVCYWFD